MAPGAKTPASRIQQGLALGSEPGLHPTYPTGSPEPHTRSGVPGRTCPMPMAPQARSTLRTALPKAHTPVGGRSCSGEAPGTGASVLAEQGVSLCLGLWAQSSSSSGTDHAVDAHPASIPPARRASECPPHSPGAGPGPTHQGGQTSPQPSPAKWRPCPELGAGASPPPPAPAFSGTHSLQVSRPNTWPSPPGA